MRKVGLCFIILGGVLGTVLFLVRQTDWYAVQTVSNLSEAAEFVESAFWASAVTLTVGLLVLLFSLRRPKTSDGTPQTEDGTESEQPYLDGGYDEQYDGQYDGQYDEPYDEQYDGFVYPDADVPRTSVPYDFDAENEASPVICEELPQTPAPCEDEPTRRVPTFYDKTVEEDWICGICGCKNPAFSRICAVCGSAAGSSL